MSVILQPAANRLAQTNYRNTVAKPVILADHAGLLAADREPLHQLYPTGAAPVWGITRGKGNKKEPAYRRCQVGDTVLFSAFGKIFSRATLTYKLHSAPLARTLWDKDKSGQTWELMYFLDDVQPVQIPYEEFNAAVDYKFNSPIQGFKVLDNVQSALFFEQFGFGDRATVTKAEFRRAVKSQITGLISTDAQIQGLRRLEQRYLRQELFPGPLACCAFCGEEFPIELLVAAHIKRRAVCTEKERLDSKHVVMPLCQFGCDALYERGYLTVSDKGIVLGTTRVLPSGTRGKIAPLEGRNCVPFKAESAPYFEWHRTHRFRG